MHVCHLVLNKIGVHIIKFISKGEIVSQSWEDLLAWQDVQLDDEWLVEDACESTLSDLVADLQEEYLKLLINLMGTKGRLVLVSLTQHNYKLT